MRNMWISAACLGALSIGALAAEAQTPPAPPTAIEKAALRALARTRISEMVERRAVRPVAPGKPATDARAPAASLSDTELRALAAGEDAGSILAARNASAMRNITAS